MGSYLSKASRTTRKYPTQPSLKPRATSSPRVDPSRIQAQNPARYQDRTPPYSSTSRTDEINQDAADPSLAAHLRALGPVTPTPTQSNTSTFNQHSSPPPPHSTSSLSQAQSNFQPQPSLSSATPSTTPHSSASTTQMPSTNPALTVLAARERIAIAAEREREGEDIVSGGGGGESGIDAGREREFVNVDVLRQVIGLRDGGMLSEDEIERRFRLKRGVLASLGRRGVVEGL